MKFLQILYLFALLAVWSVRGEDDNDDSDHTGTSTADVILALDAIGDDGTTIVSNGFGVRVYEENGKPRLVFYNANDAYEAIYCLIFEESFELENDFNETNCGGDEELDEFEVDGSDVDFGDLDWTYDTCDGTNPDYTDCEFAFYTNSDKFELLSFIFHLDYSNVTDEYFVKFDVLMKNYTWSNPEGMDSFVLNFEVSDCTGRYSDIKDIFDAASEDSEDDESTDGTDEEDEEDGSDNDDTNADEVDEQDTTGTRRLLEDGETDDDNDGDDDDNSGDSSDSNEFDFDASYFKISDTANNGAVSVTLCITDIEDDEAMANIIYSHFDSHLFQDPDVGLDNAEIAARSSETSAAKAQFSLSMFAVVIGAIAVLANYY